MKLELEKINLTPKTLEEATDMIGLLVKIILELKKENDQLREQLNIHSKNSSLPPSQDRKKKKIHKPKSERKQSAQPGHPAWQRHSVPPEKVTDIIDCKPEAFCACGGEVRLEDKVQRHQVFEIPVAHYEVIEYRLYQGSCERCQRHHKGELPAGVSKKGFGVRTQAMVSLLITKYRLSKRLAHAWFKDVYQMPICVGSVSNIEHTVSQSLQPTHEETLGLVRSDTVLHVDETSHKENHKNGWAWIISTADYTYFRLTHSRGKKVAKELIGDYQGKIIVTDRYLGYNYLPAKNHQICWAHVKRDFQRIAERADDIGQVGRRLLRIYDQVFCFWKTEYPASRTLSKKRRKRLRYFKHKMLKALKAGMHCGHGKTAHTCENLLALSQSLWRFFEVEEVPPTNNHAERQLRPLVISKKLTFGTQSDRGSRFIERMFTVITSCKQQGRDVFAFIIEALQKQGRGETPPSLKLSLLGP